ncbi:MAG: thioredoxin [Verrucomicrobia bacterium]|nr:thioredoxin [Verrucomicrobiota bacterium]
MISVKPIDVDAENWTRDVIDSETPVLVDFWAEWCGPCRTLSPIVEELAEELVGKITIAKVDVDQMPHLASQFEVRSIPTLVLMVNGEEEERVIGLANKHEIQVRLRPYVEAA